MYNGYIIPQKVFITVAFLCNHDMKSITGRFKATIIIKNIIFMLFMWICKLYNKTILRWLICIDIMLILNQNVIVTSNKNFA